MKKKDRKRQGTPFIGTEKVIVGDDKLRAQMCGQEITQILEKYDCTMVPNLEVKVRGFNIKPKPREVKKILDA